MKACKSFAVPPIVDQEEIIREKANEFKEQMAPNTMKPQTTWTSHIAKGRSESTPPTKAIGRVPKIICNDVFGIQISAQLASEIIDASATKLLQRKHNIARKPAWQYSLVLKETGKYL